MKKFLKYIGLFVLIILGAFVALFSLIVFLALASHKNQSTGNGSASIHLEYNGNGKMSKLDKPELIYADSMEEALKYNADYYFEDYPYANKVDKVVKVFENDQYAVMFYESIKNEKREAFVGTKFKVKATKGKKQYAVTLLTLEESWKGARGVEPLKGLYYTAPLFDYMRDFSISEGNRFMYGNLNTEKVKTLKIEGQSPTEVIEYTCLGKKVYFWYYENLISDKPSAEFDIQMEE